MITQLSAQNLLGDEITDLTSVTSDPQTCSVSPERHTTVWSVTAVGIPAGVRKPDPAVNALTQTDNAQELHSLQLGATSVYAAYMRIYKIGLQIAELDVTPIVVRRETRNMRGIKPVSKLCREKSVV